MRDDWYAAGVMDVDLESMYLSQHAEAVRDAVEALLRRHEVWSFYVAETDAGFRYDLIRSVWHDFDDVCDVSLDELHGYAEVLRARVRR